MTQRFLLFICISMFATSGPIWACGCSKAPAGTCPGLQKDDVVFLGTVIAIENASPVEASPVGTDEGRDNSTGGVTSSNKRDATPADTDSTGNLTPLTRYRFRIDEPFAGPETGEIDVFSGGDDGDCGYRFQKGEQYVVFTEQETNNQLFATICNGTRPASEGRALLPQLRAMRNGQRVASVFGILRRSDPPFLAPPDDPDDPLPNVSLKLRSRDDRFETSTGPGGIYSFYDVHAGEYRFTANLPVRMELTQKTLSGGLPPFKIPNGACYEYDVDALPTGHIKGSVLGPDGKPVPLASVELYRAGQYDNARPGLWGFQGAKGDFSFDHVGPGEYLLVYNRMNRLDPNSPFPRTFYPAANELDQAEPIRVKDGQQLSKINIKLHDGLPTREVRVHVQWQHGQPPGDLTVMAKAEQGNNPAVRRVAANLYQFTVLTSGRYAVSAWEDLVPQHSAPRRDGAACVVPERIETAPIAIDGSDESIPEVTLVFGDTGCAKQ